MTGFFQRILAQALEPIAMGCLHMTTLGWVMVHGFASPLAVCLLILCLILDTHSIRLIRASQGLERLFLRDDYHALGVALGQHVQAALHQPTATGFCPAHRTLTFFDQRDRVVSTKVLRVSAREVRRTFGLSRCEGRGLALSPDTFPLPRLSAHARLALHQA